MSDLKAKYEQVLLAELARIAETITVKGEAAPLYVAKDRVALLSEVRQYLAETKEGPKFGEKFRGGG